MLSGRLTHATIRILDWMASRILPPGTVPPHLRTGRRGEEDAYFHLRKLGYVMVARNFRAPNRRGEIDLIGWHQDILCFVEVKTRTTRDVKPAEAAVDDRVDVGRIGPDRDRNRGGVTDLEIEAGEMLPRVRDLLG
jgi:hypothetical protein